jgi:hypothetical protein
VDLARGVAARNAVRGTCSLFDGMAVYSSKWFPFRNSEGRWVHMARIDDAFYASPVLCNLLRGGATVASALQIAEDLTNFEEVDDE